MARGPLVYEVKQRRSRLVPGWVTAVLDFVEDPVSRYIGGSGGMEDIVLSALHRLRPRICLVRRVSREEGEKCNRIGIYITSTASLWKLAFMATLVE